VIDESTKRVRGRELKFIGSNSDKGRLSAVLYETVDTWRTYRFRIENLTCAMIWDGGEKEFISLPDAMEHMDRLEEQDQIEMASENLGAYSDAYFMLGVKKCNESMQRAKSLDNRNFFRERVKFYADELVKRGLYERTAEGKYKRTGKQLAR
jgi:hypothetical protein